MPINISMRLMTYLSTLPPSETSKDNSQTASPSVTIESIVAAMSQGVATVVA